METAVRQENKSEWIKIGAGNLIDGKTYLVVRHVPEFPAIDRFIEHLIFIDDNEHERGFYFLSDEGYEVNVLDSVTHFMEIPELPEVN